MFPRTLALCGLALFLPANRAELGYRPDTETQWTLSFEELSEFELESMIQTIAGNEISGPEAEMSGKIRRRIVVSDQGRKVEDGTMLVRGRQFETIESDCGLDIAVMGQEQSLAVSFESELAEEPLVITWDEDDEAHEFAFESDDAPDSSLLEGLTEDLDYRFLLPPEGAEQGDSWEVDLADARALFAPGGRMHLRPTEAPRVIGGVVEAHDLIAIATLSVAESSRSIEGELSATWTRTVADGDTELAVITLELEGTFEADLAEGIDVMTSSVGLPSRDEYRFETSWEVEGTGELRWDLGAGHFRSLELELETIVEISLAFSEDFGDIEVEVETSGTTKLIASAEQE